MTEHAPTPWNGTKCLCGHPSCDKWRFYNQGAEGLFDRADFEFAQRAVNAHDDLVAVLKAFLRAPSIGSSGPGSVTIEVQSFNLNAARVALAKAGAPCG